MAVAQDVLKKLPEGDKEFKPVIRFKEFGDSNINFAVVLRANDRNGHYTVKHEFIKELHKRFQKEGIDIQYPVRKLLLTGNIESIPFSGKTQTKK